MKRNDLGKMPMRILAFGLFIQSSALLFNKYFKLDDFINGFLRGLGLGLIVIALIKQKQNNDQLIRNQKKEL